MKVLLCDDHQLFVEALGGLLQERGDEVRLTVRPAEAVSVARAWRPDVCVMDRTFPDGDLGVAAARDVLDVSPDTKVMLLTGNPDAACVRAAVGVGVRGFLRKDEPLHVILQALDQIAAGLLAVDTAVLRPPAARREAMLMPGLTAREQEVLERIVHGESGQALANALEVSYSTMRTHVQNVLMKLGVHSQLEAAAYAVQHGLVRSRAG